MKPIVVLFYIQFHFGFYLLVFVLKNQKGLLPPYSQKADIQ